MHLTWYHPETLEYNKKLALYKHLLPKDKKFKIWSDNLKYTHNIGVLELNNIPFVFLTLILHNNITF